MSVNLRSRTTRLLLVVLVLLSAVYAAFQLTPGLSSAQVTGIGRSEKDLAELHKLTGQGKVVIHLVQNPATFTGRIKGVAQVLGKTYLQVQTDTTEMVLISVDAIAAIRQTLN